MDPIVYGVVGRDNTGLYYQIRSRADVRSCTGIVQIFKGTQDVVLTQSQEFVDAKKKKKLRFLTDSEITDLL